MGSECAHSRLVKAALWCCAMAVLVAASLLATSHTETAAAQGNGSARKKTGTYYFLVFSNPVAGTEDEYNRWYNELHQKDVVSIPGFMTAQRFVISEVQLRESKPLPKYLVIYKIVTDDLAAVYAEVSRRLQTGITKMSPAYDRATSISFTYRAIRPIVYHHGENAGSPHSGSQEYVQIVFSDPATAALEQQYNTWYDQKHEPQVVSSPGFVEAQRFVLSDVQSGKSQPLSKYLVIYKIISGDLAARFADYRRLAPSMSTSPAMGMSYGYTYKAIEPMIDGDQVRAERAKQKAASATTR